LERVKRISKSDRFGFDRVRSSKPLSPKGDFREYNQRQASVYFEQAPALQANPGPTTRETFNPLNLL
jgi:hypothetical protein